MAASHTLLSLSFRRSREMDGIMLDLQAMKDTLIAIERETYNITAIIVRLLPEQNTLIKLQAIKTSLLAIEDKTDILATIINTLIQESTLIGRLQSISRDVQAMLTQMERRDTSAQHSATQSQPTVQQSYEPGQATLKRRRIEYDHRHQPIAKTNMQHPALQSQPTVTMQQNYCTNDGRRHWSITASSINVSYSEVSPIQLKPMTKENMKLTTIADPSIPRKGTPPPPNFWAMSRPNGRMDQDVPWYVGKPWPRRR